MDSLSQKSPQFYFLLIPRFGYGRITKNENRGIRGKFQKLSFTLPVMHSGYSAQLDHLILFFIYNTDYFSKLLFSFELFFKQKIVNRNFVYPSENTFQLS